MLWVSRDVAARADVVWRLLVEVDEWPRWGPSVAGAEVAGGRIGPGAGGSVRTAVGVSLPFEVTRWEEGLRWAWSVAGVPATKHRVRAVTDDACTVSFGIPWWAPAYVPVCALALRRIESIALSG